MRFEILALDIDEVVADRDAGIADEHVEAAEAFERALEGGVDGIGIGDIDALGRELGKLRRHGGEPPPALAPDADLGAVGEEALGDGGADAGGAAGDDHALAHEIGHVPSRLVARSPGWMTEPLR